jgi:hypothetical protein
MKLADILSAAATFLEADGAAHDINKAASLHKLRPAKGCDTASRQDIAALLRAEAVKQRIEPKDGSWKVDAVVPGGGRIRMRANLVSIPDDVTCRYRVGDLIYAVSPDGLIRIDPTKTSGTCQEREPRPHLRTDGVPTRCDLHLHTPAELAIRKAVDEVEKIGADPKLTEAVNLLDMARERVADVVEGR